MNILGGFIFGGIQKMLKNKDMEGGGDDKPVGIENGGNTCWLAAFLQAYRNIGCYKNLVIGYENNNDDNYIATMKFVFENNKVNQKTAKYLGDLVLEFCKHNAIPNMNMEDLEKEFKNGGQHDIIPFQFVFNNHFTSNTCQKQSYTLNNVELNMTTYTKDINKSVNIDIIIDKNKTLINNGKYNLQKIIDSGYLKIDENSAVITILNMSSSNKYIDIIKVSELDLFNNKFNGISKTVNNYIKNKNNKDIWKTTQSDIYKIYKNYQNTDENFNLFNKILNSYNSDNNIIQYLKQEIEKYNNIDDTLIMLYKLYYFYFYSQNMDHEINYIKLCSDVSDTKSIVENLVQKEIIDTTLNSINFDKNIFKGVCFPEEITINNKKYILKSIVIHFGSHKGGHYTSIVRKPEGYYYCDDDKINKIEDLKTFMKDKTPAAVIYEMDNNTKYKSSISEKIEPDPKQHSIHEKIKSNDGVIIEYNKAVEFSGGKIIPNIKIYNNEIKICTNRAKCSKSDCNFISKINKNNTISLIDIDELLYYTDHNSCIKKYLEPKQQSTHEKIKSNDGVIIEYNKAVNFSGGKIIPNIKIYNNEIKICTNRAKCSKSDCNFISKINKNKTISLIDIDELLYYTDHNSCIKKYLETLKSISSSSSSGSSPSIKKTEIETKEKVKEKEKKTEEKVKEKETQKPEVKETPKPQSQFTVMSYNVQFEALYNKKIGCNNDSCKKNIEDNINSLYKIYNPMVIFLQEIQYNRVSIIDSPYYKFPYIESKIEQPITHYNEKGKGLIRISNLILVNKELGYPDKCLTIPLEEFSTINNRSIIALQYQQRNLLIVGVFFPHYTSNNFQNIQTKINQILDQITVDNNTNIIIGGDFNFDIFGNNLQYKTFNIKIPKQVMTCNNAYAYDHIITSYNNSEYIKNLSIKNDASDHIPVILKINNFDKIESKINTTFNLSFITTNPRYEIKYEFIPFNKDIPYSDIGNSAYYKNLTDKYKSSDSKLFYLINGANYGITSSGGGLTGAFANISKNINSNDANLLFNGKKLIFTNNISDDEFKKLITKYKGKVTSAINVGNVFRVYVNQKYQGYHINYVYHVNGINWQEMKSLTNNNNDAEEKKSGNIEFVSNYYLAIIKDIYEQAKNNKQQNDDHIINLPPIPGVLYSAKYSYIGLLDACRKFTSNIYNNDVKLYFIIGLPNDQHFTNLIYQKN